QCAEMGTVVVYRSDNNGPATVGELRELDGFAGFVDELKLRKIATQFFIDGNLKRRWRFGDGIIRGRMVRYDGAEGRKIGQPYQLPAHKQFSQILFPILTVISLRRIRRSAAPCKIP